MPIAANPEIMMTDPSVSLEMPQNGETLAFPASVAQQSFWYLELLEKNVTAFNVPLRFRLDGPLDVALLKRALETIAERHEVLRVHFEEDDGELLQIVEPTIPLPLPVHDVSHLPPAQRSEEADRLCSIEAKRPFNLATGPLYRAELVKLSDEVHHLHITIHHALFDGLSIGVFVHELAEIHRALKLGKSDPLPLPPLQYGDFSVWQKSLLESPDLAAHLEWWKTRLAGMEELDLPTDRARPLVKSWKGDIISTPVPDDLTQRLAAIANRNGATLFHLHLAAFKILLHRYTGSTDISVGTPVSGRLRSELEPLIGVFINSLILRDDLSGDPSFETLLHQVRDHALTALEHRELPFENLVRALKPERDSSRNPLFQINFSHDRFSSRPQDIGGVTLSQISSRSPGSIFDLHLFMTERDGAWRACCDFSTDLFDHTTASRMLGHFIQLLGEIADAPSKQIGTFDILTESERQSVLGNWKGTTSSFPKNASLPELFSETARAHPDRTALAQGEVTLSYADLHRKASALASRLANAGVKQGDLVAISHPPSPELIVGILGILLAGGAYVPMNPEDPEDRTAMLLEECGTRYLLSANGPVANFNGNVIPISETEGATSAKEIPFPKAESPAYLMFTSGSTGKPKGALVPHRAVVRLVKNTNFISIRADDVFLLAAPATFDASTLEIWGALLNGAKLVIPDKGNGLDQLADTIRKQGVTNLWLTAGLFNLMVEEHIASLSSLRHLLAGGDILSVPHVRKAFKALPDTAIINGYGPTENTTFTTCHRIKAEDLDKPAIPIGKAIANTSVYLLDSDGRPVPAGIPGELHTGGDGLAIGYWQDTELTAQKFVEHPQFGRLYRTGDLCRWTTDGTIEFLGRRDHQVKVRGFRIELGEIEAVLSTHHGIRESKVAVRGGNSETKRIIAWVTPQEGKEISTSLIARFLEERLPSFMCPDAIGVVEKFPVTRNGKIDVSALPDPRQKHVESEGGQPIGETEQRLATLWRELLEIEELGRDEDFFSLGGHSLMALRMFSRISRDFGRSLPLSSLISHPTVKQLATLLEPDVETPITETPGKGHLVTLSPGGNDTPLFCIHGGDGGILFYRDLAALLPKEVPVFAIESEELASSEVIEQTSVEDTAKSYVKTLLATHPRGPFRLAGYSFGGVVAYEMACILSAAGHRVDFVGLLDTHNPSAPSRSFSMMERVAFYWKQNDNVPLVPRTFKLAGRFMEGVATNRRVKNEEQAATEDGPAEAHGDLRRVQVRQENWRAMQAYRPRPYPGVVTLFKAAIQSDKVESPEDYGWSELSPDFRIIPVAGKHLTLFEPENVDHLANALRPALLRKSDEA